MRTEPARLVRPFLVLALLTGCSDGHVAQVAKANPAVAGPAAAPAPKSVVAERQACPQTFEAFLAQFLSSGESQRAATAEVIESGDLVEDPNDQYRLVTTRTARSALSFPIMPLASEHKAANLAYKVAAAPNGDRLVEFHKEESDAFEVTYRFRHTNCWTLVEMVDQSL